MLRSPSPPRRAGARGSSLNCPKWPSMPKGTGKTTRLVIVDDSEVLRLGLRTLFSEAGGFEVIGEAATMARAVTEAARLHPDVVLMDVRLPDGSGVEACRLIRAQRPEA